MIDMLVLRCNFAQVVSGNKTHWPDFKLNELKIPLEQSIDRDGNVSNTRHAWETIPSSYSGLAFKVFDFRYNALDAFYIELKGSPAKLTQGHNIFGSDDIYDCAFAMMELFFTAYPDMVPYLDIESLSLAQIDLTYTSTAPNGTDARAFVNALQQVSAGHTKSRTGYDGTAYFGKKNSRLKKIKVYCKHAEVLETMKKNEKKPNGKQLNAIYTPELLEYSKNIIRWEVSLYHRYFERLGISTKLKNMFKLNSFRPERLKEYWENATKDLFNALQGQEMKVVKDDEVKAKLRAKFSKTSAKTGKTSTVLADSVFRTYRDICRDGWNIALQHMSKRNFDRHIKMLTECGLSRAALQNMTGMNQGAEIIPFVRFIQVDFGAQYPDWYTPPPPKHVNPHDATKPNLSLVDNTG